MSDTQPFWESCYEAGDEATAFGPPSPEVLAVAEGLTPGARILDIGCGDGRHAIPCARLGHDVTALDVSERAIRKVERLADLDGVQIRAAVADIRRFDFAGPYDLVIAYGCLHLLYRQEWATVLEQAKAHTRPRGYHAIAVFTDALPPPDDLARFHVGLFKRGELFAAYQDWRLLDQRSYVLEDEHPGGIRHRHPIDKVLAQRTAVPGYHAGRYRSNRSR